MSAARHSRAREVLLGAAGVAVLLLAWEVLGRLGLLGRSIPPLSEVLAAIGESGDILARAAAATGGRALVGGLIGFGIGLVLAAVTAWIPGSASTVVRTAVLINAIPVVALGPVLMSLDARPFIPEIFAALSVLFSTVITAGDGFRSASRSSRDLFAVYGTGRWARFWRLDAPTGLPLVADAFRLAVPAALLGAILGEWFGADRGLGVLMVSSMRNLQYGLLWAAALVAVMLSATVYAIGGVLERAAVARFSRPGQAASALEPIGRVRGLVLAVAVPAALVLAWQLWIVVDEVPLIVAPPPADVAVALGAEIGAYLAAAGLTVLSAMGGLLAGALVGLGLAVLATLAPWLGAMLAPLALLIPTVPIVVFIPIVGSLLGYGVETVFVSTVLMAFFPMYVLALSGLNARPAGSDDLFRVYGAGTLVRLRRLALPASVPSLMIALRLSSAMAILIAISAEWLMGQGGLGRVFSERRVVLDTAGSWAAVVVAIVLSVAAYAAASRLERSVADRWRS